MRESWLVKGTWPDAAGIAPCGDEAEAQQVAADWRQRGADVEVTMRRDCSCDGQHECPHHRGARPDTLAGVERDLAFAVDDMSRHDIEGGALRPYLERAQALAPRTPAPPAFDLDAPEGLYDAWETYRGNAYGNPLDTREHDQILVDWMRPFLDRAIAHVARERDAARAQVEELEDEATLWCSRAIGWGAQRDKAFHRERVAQVERNGALQRAVRAEDELTGLREAARALLVARRCQHPGCDRLAKRALRTEGEVFLVCGHHADGPQLPDAEAVLALDALLSKEVG